MVEEANYHLSERKELLREHLATCALLTIQLNSKHHSCNTITCMEFIKWRADSRGFMKLMSEIQTRKITARHQNGTLLEFQCIFAVLMEFIRMSTALIQHLSVVFVVDAAAATMLRCFCSIWWLFGVFFCYITPKDQRQATNFCVYPIFETFGWYKLTTKAKTSFNYV